MTSLTAKGYVDINTGHKRWPQGRRFACRCGLMLLLMLLGGHGLLAQKDYRMVVVYADTIPPPSLQPRERFRDSSEAMTYLQQWLGKLQTAGYLAAATDTVNADSRGARISLYLGKRYQWQQLTLEDSSAKKLQAAGLKLPEFSAGSRQPDPAEYLRWLANHGYPFASIGLADVQINGSSISGTWQVDPGPRYLLDSIENLGPLRLKPYFLYRLLDMPKGSLYREDQLLQTQERLETLVFAQSRKPPQVQMLASGSVLQVDLARRNSNIINLLVGAMPRSSQTPDEQLQITADVNLLLRNSFGHGETIGFTWQQLQYKSPRLQLQFAQPYLFGSRLGADLLFELFRKDTQFLNLRYRAGIPIQVSPRRRAVVAFTGTSTAVTTVDTMLVLSTYRLPDLADMSVNQFELSWQQWAPDNRLSPRRGLEYAITVAAGLKRVRPEAAILNLKDPGNPGFDFGSLYDTVATRTWQGRISLQGAQYIPVGRQGVLRLGIQAGWLQSSNYFRNELFQIGGFRLLRGFDEESIFTRGYGVAATEYRLLTGRNSYFFGFVNAGLASLPVDGNRFSKSSFLGTGLGFTLETKNSLINFSWAVGRQDNAPLDLQRSKIHLGFINFF